MPHRIPLFAALVVTSLLASAAGSTVSSARATSGAALLEAIADATRTPTNYEETRVIYKPLFGAFGVTCQRRDCWSIRRSLHHISVAPLGPDEAPVPAPPAFAYRVVEGANEPGRPDLLAPASAFYQEGDGSFRFGPRGCLQRVSDFTAAELARMRRPALVDDILSLDRHPRVRVGAWAKGRLYTVHVSGHRHVKLTFRIKLDAEGLPASAIATSDVKLPAGRARITAEVRYSFTTKSNSLMGRPMECAPGRT